MKCASATAGIASVVTGLAVVLSGAPAHATFMYLHQSQLIGAAISASSVASASGQGSATDLEVRYGDEDIAPVADEAEGSDAKHARTEMVYAGLQQPAAGVYSNDARSVDRDNYSAQSGFRWMNPRSSVRADSALPRYRAESNVSRPPAASSPASTSPAKDAPAGTGGVTAPAASPPVSHVGAPTPPSTSNPNEAGSPPVHSTPISSPPTVETPIVGLPSKTVPEPSTIGLLGIGLLLVFIGIARGKRARYYSKVSASPRSARQWGRLARSLHQDGLNKA